MLLERSGAGALTDSWFTETPQHHPGERLGIAPEALPDPDAIVASDDHDDRVDTAALAWLRDE